MEGCCSNRVRVGEKAPDFTAEGYFKKAFDTFRLSDYAKKWVLLFFYPGDFTYV
ncbi:hypothetical protein EII26_06555 [Fretibacterium sp. OH1220_COT-178]|nr:hypothetical protein EII26_06555 [Fretibacterium sp. OH1220_COT-178]